MQVVILKAFTGYQSGQRINYKLGTASIPKSYVEQANLVAKGLVIPAKSDKKPDA